MTDRPLPSDEEQRGLCRADRFTHWYCETEYEWVADCEACAVPMVVWWHHGIEPPNAIRAELPASLALAADERFGAGEWWLDTEMRQVPDHFHAHARDRDR